jgi:hypothetical protein
LSVKQIFSLFRFHFSLAPSFFCCCCVSWGVFWVRTCAVSFVWFI